MPIQVTCPGCLSRFTVSEKFAGKTGPCPKCKKEIRIPEKSDEVVIHAPENDGPKDSTGKLVLKPVRREYMSLTRNAWIGIIVGVLAVFIGAIFVRFSSNGSPHWLLLAMGAIAIAPPLIVAGYGAMRDQELEGFSGKELLVRTLICTAVFAATWGLYVLLSRYLDNKTVAETPALQMGILMGVMIALGSTASLLAMELEVGQAIFHYIMYLLVTFILCMIMGIALGEPLAVPDPNAKPRRGPPVPGAPKTPPKTSRIEGYDRGLHVG